jgi:hypothetical protein
MPWLPSRPHRRVPLPRLAPLQANPCSLPPASPDLRPAPAAPAAGSRRPPAFAQIPDQQAPPIFYAPRKPVSLAGLKSAFRAPISPRIINGTLRYDPETGLFYWLGGQKKTRAGQIAGTIDKDGYIIICADRRLYRAHRLAWLWVSGEWPQGQVDHRDLDKANNRFLNLREATKSQNMRNLKCRSSSATGIKGVQFDPRRNLYYAKITTEGRKTWLGYHQTIDLAAAAYLAAAQEHHKEFARAA